MIHKTIEVKKAIMFINIQPHAVIPIIMTLMKKTNKRISMLKSKKLRKLLRKKLKSICKHKFKFTSSLLINFKRKRML